MSRHPRAGAVAIVAVLLLAVVIAGCGRGRLAGGDGAAAPHETLAATLDDPPVVVEPTPTAGTITTPTPPRPEPPGPAPTTAPTPAPLVAPDLTSIQQLLDDLDAALGADATADTDEGSPK